MIEKNEFECECHEEHTELIEQGKALLPETTELYNLSDFFKVLGDSTRLGILCYVITWPMWKIPSIKS